MDILHKAIRFVSKHSPTILTVTAVVGVGATAYLTARAAIRADRYIQEAEKNVGPADDAWVRFEERFKMTWQYYIPPVAAGVATAACIIGTHGIHSRRNAALLGIYTLTDTAFREYREKIVETVGQSKEQRVRDDIKQDHVNANPPSRTEVIVTGRGDVLCLEAITGRYFYSDVESIRKAQNDINHQVIQHMYASHNEFCSIVGLPSTPLGDQIGWTLDNLMDLDISATVSDDGRPCLVIDYRISPKSDYYKLN